MDFLVYEVTASALYLGERAKGNVFKPCLRTIPYSAITGALNRLFQDGRKTEEIKAVGFLVQRVGCNRLEVLTYSPQNRGQRVSKIPLQVEYLADARGHVVVVANDTTSGLPERFEITLGGMRSHGFGWAGMKFLERRRGGEPRLGRLRVRLPEDETGSFGILRVEAPVYGYLFKPTQGSHTGVYVRSLFEGSRVVASELLLEPGGG